MEIISISHWLCDPQGRNGFTSLQCWPVWRIGGGWCGAALHGGWFSFVTLSYIKRGIESRCLDSGYLPEPSAHRSKSEFGMMMINKGPVIGQVGRLPGAAL